MKKLKSLSGKELIAKIKKQFGYEKIRQKGSHIRLGKGNNRLTVPLHKDLDEGTKPAIIKEIARQLNLPVEEVIDKLTK